MIGRVFALADGKGNERCAVPDMTGKQNTGTSPC